MPCASLICAFALSHSPDISIFQPFNIDSLTSLFCRFVSIFLSTSSCFSFNSSRDFSTTLSDSTLATSSSVLFGIAFSIASISLLIPTNFCWSSAILSQASWSHPSFIAAAISFSSSFCSFRSSTLFFPKSLKVSCSFCFFSDVRSFSSSQRSRKLSQASFAIFLYSSHSLMIAFSWSIILSTALLCAESFLSEVFSYISRFIFSDFSISFSSFFLAFSASESQPPHPSFFFLPVSISL